MSDTTFDFSAWFAATGWDRPTAALRIGVSKATIDRALADGPLHRISAKTAAKAVAATQQHIADLTAMLPGEFTLIRIFPIDGRC